MSTENLSRLVHCAEYLFCEAENLDDVQVKKIHELGQAIFSLFNSHSAVTDENVLNHWVAKIYRDTSNFSRLNLTQLSSSHPIRCWASLLQRDEVPEHEIYKTAANINILCPGFAKELKTTKKDNMLELYRKFFNPYLEKHGLALPTSTSALEYLSQIDDLLEGLEPKYEQRMVLQVYDDTDRALEQSKELLGTLHDFFPVDYDDRIAVAQAIIEHRNFSNKILTSYPTQATPSLLLDEPLPPTAPLSIE